MKNEMADSKNLVSQEHMLIRGLCEASQSFSSATSVSDRQQGYVDLLNVLCEYISNRYPELVVEESLKPNSAVANDPLHFLKMHLDLLQREAPLSTDFLRWLLTRLILTTGSHHVREDIVTNIRKHACEFITKLLPEEEFLEFIICIIDQLREYSSVTYLSLWSSKKIVPSWFAADKVINLKNFTPAERDSMRSTLIAFLTADGLPLTALPDYEIYALWMSTIDLFSTGSFTMKTAVLSVWTKLLSSDVANWMVCRIAIDRLLQLENIQECAHPAYDTEKESFYEIFSEALRSFDERKSLRGIDLQTVIHWAESSILIFLNSLKKNKSILQFARAACQVLSSAELDDNDWKDMEGLTQHASKLINYFFENYNGSETDEILEPFVSLPHADTKSENSWITYIGTQQALKMKTDLDKLKFSRKFISILQKCKVSEMRVSLEKLAPTQETILKFVEEACRNNDTSLYLTLTAIVSDLTIAECISSNISLPFLSLPFFSNENVLVNASSRRHQSIPALKDFTKFAYFIKTLSKDREAEGRLLCIVPLTKMTKHSEWRRLLYTTAIKDKNAIVAEKALNYMHKFLVSVGITSFNFLVDAANEVTAIKAAVVMQSIARCICVLDSFDKNVETFVCDICSGSNRKLDSKRKNKLEHIPDSLIKLMTEKWKEPNNTCLGSLKLTCALLFHYPNAIPESRLSETLVFMENSNEAVRDQYLHLFKHVVTTTDNRSLSEYLQTKLPFYESKMDDVILDPFSAKYLTICAQYAKDKGLATWAFGKHYSIILQNQEYEFLNSMRNLVRDISSLEEMSTTTVFLRRIRTITRELCTHLISFGSLASPSGYGENIIEEIMNSLELTRKIFFFEDVAAMLKLGAKYIIPSLLLCNPEERPWALIVIEKIREMMKLQKESLGTEFFPYFLVQWILQHGTSHNESDAKFIYSACGVQMTNIANSRYLCTQGLLQMLSFNESNVSQGIAYLNNALLHGQSFSITNVMLINCEYVGYFLKYRWCLTADDHYEQRSVLLQSLELIIRRLERDFLEIVANRLMSVLRAATKIGEAAIPVWLQFATRLSRKTFKDLLPRILIDIQPLLQYDSSDELISLILSNNKISSEIEDLHAVHERDHILYTTVVLIGCDHNGSNRLQKYVDRIPLRDRPPMTPEVLIKTCVHLLSVDCETVGKVVLNKLHSLLDGNPLEEELMSSLIPVLLQTLRRCCDPESRLLTVMCIGRLGAVDPGRLDILHTVFSDQTTVFIDDKDDFFVDLIERTWRAYSREPEFQMLQQIEYSIQELLLRLVGKKGDNHILDRLSDACRKDILPLKSTKLGANKEPKWTAKNPIVDNVSNFSEWLQQCFVMGAHRVRQEPIKYVFRALKWIANTTDTHFTRYILSQLILRLIIENDTDVIDMYVVEMETVLRHVVEGGPNWMHLAAHIVFSILDTLELFVQHRKEKRAGNIDSDPELNRTICIIQAVADKKIADGQLLIVIAAEKCNCFYRALKWCEQFALSNLSNCHAFFTLERIYMSLQNVDGVLGSFECISNCSVPTANERILALEAAGDYHEAMALYALSGPKNEAEMVKCLLRLNQPQLALCTSTAAYNRYIEDESISDVLYANQIEAACLLQDWEQLENLVQKRDPITLGKRSTWGASCASILCAVKREEADVLTKRLKSVREILVDQLTAMTIEHSDTYTQAYNYVTQLHILDEIEDASQTLQLVSKEQRRSSANDFAKTLTKWQARSENAAQCAASLESILSVRRELLKLYNAKETKSNISQLLIQSCRLARQAGHLQIAWTFLVEAQALDVNHKDVGLEQARFEFQKGDQQQAISLLTKLLHGRFEKMTDLFSEYVQYVESGTRLGSDQILTTKKEERASFAEVQLLRAEYMMKAGAVSSGDLYRIYMALRKIQVPSEDLFYRIALFCDGLYSLDTTNVRTDLVNIILKTYSDALKFGRNHLFHAMPRMLTLWLDCTQKKHDQLLLKMTDNSGAAAQEEAKERDKMEIQKINEEMLNIFRHLDPYYFFKAYPQLISRIEHNSDNVFNALKIIIADLLVRFPHQCLWLSIAVYRSGPYEQNIRQKRCNIIFQLAKQKDRRLENLIDQYDYIAQCLIKTAEQKYVFGTHDNLPQQFKQLDEFFTKGHMDKSLLMGAKARKLSGITQVQPTIMVPLTEMMDHAIPKLVEHQCESFSQIVIDSASPTETAMGALPEVLIQKFENTYMVLKSMMQPKKLSIRSQDGRVFHVMIKPGDELRKDARFMDVNRMMNSLMRQNPESRRRQLMVRTFTVIPLQSAGGILEWLPNLISYRHALQPLCDEKTTKRLSDPEWFKNWDNTATIEWKLKRINLFYECYPLVMGEWFRREFVDPSSWHSARSNYARSAAVMSMIGFILGLGDRHGENILLDQKDGCVVHVDYNLLFNKGEQLPVKEIVPFRLTRNMIDGLGPTGVEGTFRKSCEAAMRVMRDNRDTLLTVIQAFVHDPLLEWQDSTRAQQNRSRRGEKVTAGHIAADAVALIGKRLEGHIVTPEVYRWKFSMSPMSLEGQVNKLIEIASDEKQLVQMYIGWAPFM